MTRLARWLVWPVIFGIAAVSLCPIQFRRITPAPADVERIFAFTALGFLLSIAYPKYRLLCLLLAVVGTALLEATQNYVPGRHGHLHDFGVKAVCITVGMLLGILLLKTSWNRLSSGRRG